MAAITEELPITARMARTAFRTQFMMIMMLVGAA